MAEKRPIVAAGYSLSALIVVIATAMMLAPPGDAQPPNVPGLDKLAHASVFFLIVLPIISVRPAAWVWLVPIAIGYGGVIELIQPYFGRERELGDFIANSVGVGLAVAVGRANYRWLSQRWKTHQGEGPKRQH